MKFFKQSQFAYCNKYLNLGSSLKVLLKLGTVSFLRGVQQSHFPLGYGWVCLFLLFLDMLLLLDVILVAVL